VRDDFSRFSFGHSEFDDFLFASIGEEKNGIELTVLSALTRLGFDPWAEAARLSDLPGETAERALVAAIGLLPDGDWKTSNARAIATRLVDQLPRRRGQSPREKSREVRKPKSVATLWFVAIALVVAVILGSWGQ